MFRSIPLCIFFPPKSGKYLTIAKTSQGSWSPLRPCDYQGLHRTSQGPCLTMVGGYIPWGQLFIAIRLCLAPDTRLIPPKRLWSKSDEILALDHLASKFPMSESSGLCHMGRLGGKGPSYQPSKFGGLEGQDRLDIRGTEEIHYSNLFWQLWDTCYF